MELAQTKIGFRPRAAPGWRFREDLIRPGLCGTQGKCCAVGGGGGGGDDFYCYRIDSGQRLVLIYTLKEAALVLIYTLNETALVLIYTLKEAAVSVDTEYLLSKVSTNNLKPRNNAFLVEHVTTFQFLDRFSDLEVLHANRTLGLLICETQF